MAATFFDGLIPLPLINGFGHALGYDFASGLGRYGVSRATQA